MIIALHIKWLLSLALLAVRSQSRLQAVTVVPINTIDAISIVKTWIRCAFVHLYEKIYVSLFFSSAVRAFTGLTGILTIQQQSWLTWLALACHIPLVRCKQDLNFNWTALNWKCKHNSRLQVVIRKSKRCSLAKKLVFNVAKDLELTWRGKLRRQEVRCVWTHWKKNRSLLITWFQTKRFSCIT